MTRTRFLDLLTQKDRAVLGSWSQIDSADAVEVLAAGGFDFTIIDTEHTAFGLDRAQELLRAADACGLTAAVRVAAIDRTLVAKAVDAGASAVVVPGIRTAEEVETVSGWMRFGGGGTRGACPCVRATGQAVGDWATFAADSDRQLLCLPLIETPEAVDSIEAIVSVEGLRCLILGPFDLSVAMGHSGATSASEVKTVVRRVLDACKAAGVTPILPLFEPTPEALAHRMEEWREEGVRMFTLGTDKLLLATIARALTCQADKEETP